MFRYSCYLLGTGNERIRRILNGEDGSVQVAEKLSIGYFVVSGEQNGVSGYPGMLQITGWRRPEEVLYSRLLERGEYCSFVESCTGGLCAEKVTQIPGSSSVFWGGWVVYSNEAKERLGVPRNILNRFGAVSRQTVISLAQLGRKHSGTERCAAISGIAGPSGGSAEKPAGTVWIGIDNGNGGAKGYRFLFSGTRNDIREKAAAAAYMLLGR